MEEIINGVNRDRKRSNQVLMSQGDEKQLTTKNRGRRKTREVG